MLEITFFVRILGTLLPMLSAPEVSLSFSGEMTEATSLVVTRENSEFRGQWSADIRRGVFNFVLRSALMTFQVLLGWASTSAMKLLKWKFSSSKISNLMPRQRRFSQSLSTGLRERCHRFPIRFFYLILRRVRSGMAAVFISEGLKWDGFSVAEQINSVRQDTAAFMSSIV